MMDAREPSRNVAHTKDVKLLRRTAAVKYYFVDFELSSMYDPSQPGDDPFAMDVFTLGDALEAALTWAASLRLDRFAFAEARSRQI